MSATPGPAGPPWAVTTGECSPQTVGRLLGLLPAWFGIPSANADYVAAAGRLPTYLAWPGRTGGPVGGAPPTGSQPVGVLLAERHFAETAEIHLMAVDPAVHRRGVGRAMVGALERDLIADRVGLLEVKTLGPSHPDAGYALTRLFYQSMGFAPVEELLDLWPGNPCLIMIKVLGSPALTRPRRNCR